MNLGRLRKKGGCLSNPHPLPLPLLGLTLVATGIAQGEGREFLGDGVSKAHPIPQIFHPLSAKVLHGSGCCQRRGGPGEVGEGSFRMYLGPCEENGQGRYVGKQTQLGRRPARASQGRLPEIPVLTFTEQVSEDSSWGAWDRLCRTWGCYGLPAPRWQVEEM